MSSTHVNLCRQRRQSPRRRPTRRPRRRQVRHIWNSNLSAAWMKHLKPQTSEIWNKRSAIPSRDRDSPLILLLNVSYVLGTYARTVILLSSWVLFYSFIISQKASSTLVNLCRQRLRRPRRWPRRWPRTREQRRMPRRRQVRHIWNLTLCAAWMKHLKPQTSESWNKCSAIPSRDRDPPLILLLNVSFVLRTYAKTVILLSS